MGDKNNGLFVVFKINKVIVAFLLEGGVADGEDFIEEQDVTAGANGDREGQANLHAGRIIFELLVLKIFELGKFPNIVIHGVYFFIAKTEESAVHIDIFATGKFGIKPDAEFDERNEIPVNSHSAFFWIINTGENFEQSGFAGAVTPDDADELTFFDFEVEAF